MSNDVRKLGNVWVTIGNTALGKDTVIFNYGSGETCPSSILGLCLVDDVCMRIWMEGRFPHIKLFKEKQTDYWFQHKKEEILKHWLRLLKRNSYLEYVRISELGDFWSQLCVWKQQWISKRIFEETGVITYGYTARSDLEYDDCSPYFVLKGSGHDQCPNGSTTVLFPGDPLPENYILCRKANGKACYGCNICKHTNKNVAFKLHGPSIWVNHLLKRRRQNGR